MGTERKPADSYSGPRSDAAPEASPSPQPAQPKDVFDALFADAPTGIYVALNAVIRYVNRRMQVYTGRTRGDLQGQHYLRLVVSEDRDMVKQNLIKVANGEHVLPYDYRIVSEAGDT